MSMLMLLMNQFESQPWLASKLLVQLSKSMPKGKPQILLPIPPIPTYISSSHFHTLFYIVCKLTCFHLEAFLVELVSQVSVSLLVEPFLLSSL